MQCPKCDYMFEDSFEIQSKQPIYFMQTVRAIGEQLARIDEPSLKIDKALGDLSIENRKNWNVKCPGCDTVMPLLELVYNPSCICGTGVTKDDYCVVNAKYFCPKDYKLILARLCAKCEVRDKCKLYSKANI